MSFPDHIHKISLKKRNMMKYHGIQPSWELVMKVIKKSGLKTRMNFQRTWGIPGQVLNQYKGGERDIPAHYWHIFYEYDAMVKILAKKIKEADKNETVFGYAPPKQKETPPPKQMPILNKKLIDDQIRF
jgi:hypothetical protein